VSSDRISVIIPARNEEQNLPRLLESIHKSAASPEVIVVDDASTDATALVAAQHGATVLPAATLPRGWTGKTWAIAQGSAKAAGDLLLFLDADTWFEPDGFDRLISAWRQQDSESLALSLLPFHVTQKPYEELSLFFNLLMAFGAGGFGRVGKPRLFGQCLLIPRVLYDACGGHEAVRGRILENLAMADRIEAAGGSCMCLGGRGALQVRLFPDGLSQLRESWTKAFADGAAASDSAVLALAIAWLSALSGTFLALCFAHGQTRVLAAGLYLAAVAQVLWSARQVGGFRWTTALLYPVPLIFFFGLFTSSLLNRVFRRQVTWRGRRI
jgi:4,4'-diaponeurosporenoate glycosyltransferase